MIALCRWYWTHSVSYLQAVNAIDQSELGVENGRCRFLNNSYRIVNFVRRRLPINVALCATCIVLNLSRIHAKIAIAKSGQHVEGGRRLAPVSGATRLCAMKLIENNFSKINPLHIEHSNSVPRVSRRQGEGRVRCQIPTLACFAKLTTIP